MNKRANPEKVCKQLFSENGEMQVIYKIDIE